MVTRLPWPNPNHGHWNFIWLDIVPCHQTVVLGFGQGNLFKFWNILLLLLREGLMYWFPQTTRHFPKGLRWSIISSNHKGGLCNFYPKETFSLEHFSHILLCQVTSSWHLVINLLTEKEKQSMLMLNSILFSNIMSVCFPHNHNPQPVTKLSV